MATELQAQLRTNTGSGFSNRLRLQGILPGVVYGKGSETKSLQVHMLEIEKILRTKLGRNTFINLKVEGDKDYTVLIKDFQGDAITRKLTHIDFWQVSADQEVLIDVEVRLEGKAAGLLQGGIMEQTAYNVRLRCKANAIIEELVVDVSKLEIGDKIHLAEIQLPEGVSRIEDYNPNIVSIVEEKEQPLEAQAPAAESAEAAAAAPAEAKADEKGKAEGEAKAEDKAKEGDKK